jgi:hypothetical protein
MPFTRRVTLAVLAAVGFPVAAKATPEFEQHAEYWLPYMCPMADSFAELTAWFETLPVKQVDGSATAICEQTGKPYLPHSFVGLARPGDEKTVEGHVASRMQWSIVEAVGLVRPKRPEDVTFHWRHRLEFEVADHTSYDPALQRFVQVENWRAVSAYCRLTVSA